MAEIGPAHFESSTAPQRAATPPQGSQARCEALTKAGTACRGFAQSDRPFCLAHDPERQADARAARAKGATHANQLRSLRGARATLDSAQALVPFTAGIVHDTLEGRLDTDVARVALYGVSIMRQLLEASDLQARLEALESVLEPARGRSVARRRGA